MISRLNQRIKQQKRLKKQLDTKCSRVSKKIYKATKFIKYFAITWLILVPFFTKPRWCIDLFEGKPEFENCGFNVDFLNDEDYTADTEY